MATRRPFDVSSLTKRLERKQLAAAKLLAERHPHAAALFKKAGIEPGKIREHAGKLLTAGALAGSLLLSAPNLLTSQSQISVISPTELQNELIEGLTPLLPETVGPLTPEQEGKI